MKADVKPVKRGNPPPWLVCGMALLSLSVAAHAWVPNAKDRAAAIKAGDFTAYSGQLAAWLNQQVPADPARITKEKLMVLLRDPVFIAALAERQFIGKVWDQPDLGGYAKADPKNKAFLTWVMSNGKIMDEVLLTRTPTEMAGRYDNSWSINAGVLEYWKQICYAFPESREGLYLRLAIATALRPPGTGNAGVGMAKEQSTPLARFGNYLKAHKNHELLPSFDTLTAWELTHVVSSGASDQDLVWAREALNTWNPDFRKNENIIGMASQMQYQGSQIPYYNMACVFAGGGKCGPRSSFGVFINQAFGIPAIGVAQPAHAAVAYRDKDGNWQIALGKGWNVSKLADRAMMSGGEFLERVKERKTTAFANVEHLRWLASYLTEKARIDAVNAIVPAIADASKDTIAPFQATPAATEKPVVKPGPPLKAAPGVMHIEAGEFVSIGGISGYGPGVAALDSFTGGKQVYFAAMSQAGWVGYKIKVPKTGVYELTVTLAAMNWGQRLYARSFGAMYPVKTATASDVYRQQDALGPQMAIDQDLGTRWAMNLGKEQGWIELDLGQPREISRMIIDERIWERVSRYRVEYKAGDEWKTLFEGGDLGECKKEFPPVTTQHVRLSLLDGKGPQGGPTIWDISVGKVFDGTGWLNAEWAPDRSGCWNTTKPLDMYLVEGPQMLWLCAPPQRGLSMKSLELKPKSSKP
ncbi:MAG: discoidin domain-containing protein [Verrucomicrobia bacterium]|nr:discoidin domain-containing protein [Verrucomicrobiota bacterium]